VGGYGTDGGRRGDVAGAAAPQPCMVATVQGIDVMPNSRRDSSRSGIAKRTTTPASGSKKAGTK
jgi:hypothetical protein